MWDETLLYTTLAILRSDPASAHGFPPAKLMLGRPLVAPYELNKMDVDFEGTHKKLQF